MRDRRTLAKLNALHVVQRANKSSAEARLAAAKEHQAAKQEDLRSAGKRTIAAEDDWAEHVASASFSPLHARHFAEVVIERAAAEAAAATELRAAERRAARSEDELRKTLTQVELGKRTRQKVARAVARRTEEASLSELADRVTRSWTRA